MSGPWSWPWNGPALRFATSSHSESTMPPLCRAWVGNLEGDWDRAVAEVGVRRARVWQLYMAVSANSFDDGGIAIHQVLGVVPTSDGTSGMPLTRASFA